MIYRQRPTLRVSTRQRRGFSSQSYNSGTPNTWTSVGSKGVDGPYAKQSSPMDQRPVQRRTVKGGPALPVRPQPHPASIDVEVFNASNEREICNNRSPPGVPSQARATILRYRHRGIQ